MKFVNTFTIGSVVKRDILVCTQCGQDTWELIPSMIEDRTTVPDSKSLLESMIDGKNVYHYECLTCKHMEIFGKVLEVAG